MVPDDLLRAFDRSRLGAFLTLVEAVESDPNHLAARQRLVEFVADLDASARAEIVGLYWWGLGDGEDLATLVAEATRFDLAGAGRYLEARSDLGEALRSAYARLWRV